MQRQRVKDSIECWIARRLSGSGGRWEILLLHVPPVPDAPDGFWQPVTGGIESGETAADACCREVWEETGIALDPAGLIPIHDGMEFDLGDLMVRKAIFLAVVKGDEVRIAEDEHDGFGWVPADQVSSRLHWESNRRTWAKVLAMLLDRLRTPDLPC